MYTAGRIDTDAVIRAYKAAQANPTPSARLADVVRPASEYLSSLPVLANRLIWRRDEPILRMGLTRYADEREWEAMEQSELAVSTPTGAVIQRLLSEGWTIEKQQSAVTAAAADYQTFALAAFRRIVDFETVLDKVCRTRFYGWYPVQVLYDTFSWGNKLRRGVAQLVDHKHHYFSFTMDTSDLVFLGDYTQPPQVYDQDRDRRAWLTFRAGSTYSPFGKALYAHCWFMWDALRRLTSIYEMGQHNALLGTPIFSRTTTGGPSEFIKTDGSSPVSDVNLLNATLVAQIKDVLRIRREIGAIVLGPNMQLNDLKSIETIDGGLRAIQDYRTMLQIAIQGEQLSSSVARVGAFALGQVHEATGEGYARRIGRIVAAGFTTLARRLVDMNFPGPIAEEDYPVFQFNLENQIDVENLQAYIAMGGEVDQVPVARQFKIPLPPGATGGTLKRQDHTALTGAMLAAISPNAPRTPRAPGAPEPPPEPPQPPPPVRTRALPGEEPLEDTDAMAAALAAGERARVGGAVSAYLRALRDAVVTAAGDPADPSPKA